MNTEQKLRTKIELECCHSSLRMFDYWASRTSPQRAYILAVTAFTNNALYEKLKKQIMNKGKLGNE